MSENVAIDRTALSYPNLLIVMPAYNEAATIGPLISELKQRYPFDIVVVDDASTDDTAAVARKAGARILSHVRGLGAWKATQTGFRYAYNHEYQGVITLDADGQHLPDQIEQLLGLRAVVLMWWWVPVSVVAMYYAIPRGDFSVPCPALMSKTLPPAFGCTIWPRFGC